MGVAIPNVVTDIALLIFPIPIIWNLNISRSNRVALLGTFLIGGLYGSPFAQCFRSLITTASSLYLAFV
jgi:hypothetical protein